MNWDYYRYFLSVASTGSLKVTAKKLKVDQTTVGRNISALEKNLATRLFERRSDGFILTSAGLRIYESIQTVEEKVIAAERLLAGKDERPEGIVKIALPGALANHWLIPLLGDFIEQYPQVHLEFLTGASLINLARREADLAIRLVEPGQQGLMVRRVGSLDLGLYGHKKIFQRNSLPKKVSDLSAFSFIGLYADAMSKGERNLIGEIADAIQVKIRSAAWSSVFSSIRAGLGVGILPTFMADQDAQLVPILKDIRASMPLWLVYHPDLKHAARVRAVIDFLVKHLRKDFGA